mmetsp:Transcript_1215/g.2550  ORF Transcript_1215/g.2550 Transcript_1215/m.2550 type:complete len:81 (+) Transcript_1215:302-544(+)
MVKQHLNGNRHKYNEVIIDGDTWVENLPHSIEAVYYESGGERNALRVYRLLRTHFGLSEAQLPLLHLTQGAMPFLASSLQ